MILQSRQCKQLRLGIDIGSTTVKAIVLDGLDVVFEDYRRHHADVRAELVNLLHDIEVALPVGTQVQAAVTGSGGMSVAGSLGVSFVQEVIAGTAATREFNPTADVIVELGGEDAKLTYLHPTPEQRMNGTCAGGTGAFIDQMATLLRTDAAGLNELASRYTHLYPIASRCGVFAKSDLQPLMNQGAAPEDLAASVFQAVATQTVAGLACGRPIRGEVLFLGGPLHFLPELRRAYERILDKATNFVVPPKAQLYVAMGAALLADSVPCTLIEAIKRLNIKGTAGVETARLPALFETEADYQEFNARHSKDKVELIKPEDAIGECFLGIDAGSTTIKAVVMDSLGRILFTHYASNEGDPVRAAIDIVRHIHVELPSDLRLVRSCATGYGEGLVQAALGLDEGEIETMAHYRAAERLAPGVTSVIDIGGQDMKYLRIRNGMVDSISVNEACSSGCGSFLQTFAETMGTSIQDFASAALFSKRPVDLGTRCTVFMNSSVKQAQKEGADVGDIAAGLSYSVIRNALYKVIKIKDPSDLGEKVVVQGGTFLNDAVLRAFEELTEREVVRPNIAGLMGAYGAALTAQMHWDGVEVTTLATDEELEALQVETEMKICRLCQNHCNMTISKFSSGARHVSGNRCDRGASLEKVPKKSPIPNIYDWKYKRTFGYRRLTEVAATRGDMGIPRVLNMYENYPFWFTVLTELKFRVMISGRSSHELFETGMESIPSENICYPAKLVHGHIESLIEKGVKNIFYPCIVYEQSQPGADSNYNCPVVGTYPEVIRTNMESLEDPEVRFISPFLNFNNHAKLAERLVEEFADWNVTLPEAQAALQAGFIEDAAFKEEVRAQGRAGIEYMRQHGVRGVVLAGRPYHLDPEINHGIPEVINALGMVVLTEDSVAGLAELERPLRVRDQWSYHSRLYQAGAAVGDTDGLELVQLISFGCGVDAVTAEQVQEILEGAGSVYTALKIDEVSNLGAARIRLRSLAAAVDEREQAKALTSKEILAYPVADSSLADGAQTAANVDCGSCGAGACGAAGSCVDAVGQAGTCGAGSCTLGKAVDRPLRGHVYTKQAFTAEMKKRGTTILCPQMAPIQFRLAEPVMQKHGYNMKLLAKATKADIECGLKFVNNDACYPSIVVIGQLINQFIKGEADPDNCAVAISQTGGMCRATNYAALLRRGLRDAGFGQVPVIAVSVQGLEDNPGFKLTLPLVHELIKTLVIGDLLQKLLLRVRPYEAVPGSATALYERWNTIFHECVENKGHSATLGRKLGYKKLINTMVKEFDALELADIPRKPQVGLVGEILVKFHPDANNQAVQVIEQEGCEAVLPGLMQFFHYSAATIDWERAHLGISEGWSGRPAKLALWLMEKYEKPVRQALAKTGGKFHVGKPIAEMRDLAENILSLGNQAGEGWYLVAEMMTMIEEDCPNIICAQPFACLPNHIVGKGMFKALRKHYPQANVVAIDYDPGASEVNQLNRIKLMISTAFLQHNVDGGPGEFSGQKLAQAEEQWSADAFVPVMAAASDGNALFDIEAEYETANVGAGEADCGGCAFNALGQGDSNVAGSGAGSEQIRPPVLLGIPKLPKK